MNLFTRFCLPCTLVLSATCIAVPFAQAAPIVDKGDFLVAYPQPKKEEYRILQSVLKEGKALEDAADGLNETFALPRNITLEFKELGEANAFYDPNTQRVSIGYELIEDLRELFSKTSQDEDVVLDRTVNATIFVLAHELGHALIDVCDIPVLGKEEDAVDQLATFVLSDSEEADDPNNDNNKMVLDGAQAFLLLANRDEKTLGDMSLWDSHSLSKQRFYNILSLIYGSNPTKYNYLLTKNILPKNRAVGSKEEYAQVSKSWSRLLAPYIKD